MEFQRERYQSSTLTLSKAHKTLQGAPADALFDRLDTYIQLPNAGMFLVPPSVHVPRIVDQSFMDTNI